MIVVIASGLSAIIFYLLIANAACGPGGDKKAFEKGKQGMGDFVEWVEGDEAG